MALFLSLHQAPGLFDSISEIDFTLSAAELTAMLARG
jgi:hypothetical protein